MIDKIKIYLIARISKDAHEWNEKVCGRLKPPIKVFMPHRHNPWNLSHKEFPKEVYELDLRAMKESDMCLILPPYGRDCAWEIGWYSNSDKTIVAFVDKEIEWLRDWMIKGNISYVITNNPKTWTILSKDAILKFKKITFINEFEQLPKVLTSIYKHARGKKHG